jgi:hypothetical protein
MISRSLSAKLSPLKEEDSPEKQRAADESVKGKASGSHSTVQLLK